jgi:hypothetical protein
VYDHCLRSIDHAARGSRRRPTVGKEDLRSKHATKLTVDEFVDLISTDGVQALDRIVADLGYVKGDKPARGWFPNRPQWWVIWIGTLLAISAWLHDVVAAFFAFIFGFIWGEYWRFPWAVKHRRAEVAIAVLAVAGLLVWRLTGAKSVRKS